MEAEASDIEKSCLEWINTFSLPSPCTSFQDLKDGVVLVTILNQISADHFPLDSVDPIETDNWALRAGNIRSVLRMLDAFYRDVLEKSVDITSVGANAIAKDCDFDEVVSLLELVLGTAVQCDNKADFIGAIFSLDEMSQLVLKSMVEAAMSRSTSLDEGAGASASNTQTSPSSSEELTKAQDVIRHLQEERQKLLQETTSLEQLNDNLSGRVQELEEELGGVRRKYEQEAMGDRSRAATAETANAQKNLEIDELKRELDLRTGCVEDAENALRAEQKAHAASREGTARLEMENARMSDELDIARDRSAQLAKAESAVEKYQKRLEEMGDIKKANKELERQIDGYLDKINELEDGTKSIATLNKMIEQYKDKSIAAEREKFEAQAELELKASQLEQKQSQLDRALESKRLSEEELRNARAEFETLESSAREDEREADMRRREQMAALEALPAGETVASLVARVDRLAAEVEREREQRHQLSAAQGEATESETLLRNQIEDLERMLGEREGAVTAARAECESLRQAEVELRHAHDRALEAASATSKEEIAAARAEATAAAAALKEQSRGEELEEKTAELTHAVAMREKTISLLEDELKAKEGAINKLTQDKTKLERFAKDSLKNFKDKYLKELTKFRTERKEWKDKYNVVMKQNERNQETYRREERLLLSSMYEIGVRILDRNLSTMESSQAPATFLSSQRATIAER